MAKTNDPVATNIRVPRELWTQFRLWTVRKGVSANEVIVKFISDLMKKEK